MEAICSSETLIGFQLTTQLFISGDGYLRYHRCENLILHSIMLVTHHCMKYACYTGRFVNLLYRVFRLLAVIIALATLCITISDNDYARNLES
jgi:hypothetical protein